LKLCRLLEALRGRDKRGPGLKLYEEGPGLKLCEEGPGLKLCKEEFNN
jgi:hypothetical protein